MAVTERKVETARHAGLKLSEEEFVRLPDDGHKYELVDGEVVEVPTWWDHGLIAIRFIKLLLLCGAEEAGRLADSSTGFRMKGGNLRSPDVSFVSRERVPVGPEAKAFFNGAPDLAVEIISESEDPEDMARKVAEYLVSGARQVWQVFPHSRRIVIYHSLDQVRTYGADDEVTGGDLLPNLRARVADLLPPQEG